MEDVAQSRKQPITTSDSTSSDSLISLGKLLHVTGSEFISALKDAMVEIDASVKHREEIQVLAGFLVAFYSSYSQQFLSESQISLLTFTFRIESIEKTRNCLLSMFHTGASDIMKTKRFDKYFLVPTEAFVAYLSTRTYYRFEGPDADKPTAFQFPVRESEDFWSAKQNQFDILGLGAVENAGLVNVWTKQDTVLSNFLHFLVNMFSRTVPGNLLYGIGSEACTGDFFHCVKFLQETLLANPIDLKSIYERIWDQFQRLNREAELHVRVSEIKLYCLPIINNHWELSVLRHKTESAADGFIDKDAFVRICSDCIMWTNLETESLKSLLL